MKLINLVFVLTVLPFLKRKMISFWCNLHQEKNQWKNSVNLPQHAKFPAQLPRREGPPVCRDSSATLEQEVSGKSRERSEDASNLGKEAEVEAFRNIINYLSAERNLRDLHPKHYHMSTAQLKKRTTHLDILGKCTTFASMWRRHARSVILIFLNHRSTKIGEKPLDFLLF